MLTLPHIWAVESSFKLVFVSFWHVPIILWLFTFYCNKKFWAHLELSQPLPCGQPFLQGTRFILWKMIFSIRDLRTTGIIPREIAFLWPIFSLVSKTRINSVRESSFIFFPGSIYVFHALEFRFPLNVRLRTPLLGSPLLWDTGHDSTLSAKFRGWSHTTLAWRALCKYGISTIDKKPQKT